MSTETKFRVGLAHDFIGSDGNPIVAQKHFDRLKDAGCDPVVLPVTQEYKPGDLDDLNALIVRQTKVTEDAMAAAPNLRHVARFGAGYDRVDISAANRLKIVVSTIPNAVTKPMAMGNITFVLALAGKLFALDKLTREGRWAERSAFQGIAPYGRTLGVVGLGRIGRETARLALNIGMEVIGCTGSGRGEMDGVRLCSFEEVISEADFVCLACPLTPETDKLMGKAAFGKMKPGAFFINTARGGLVDEAALGEALSSGHLAGAALDVFREEPISADNPLKNLDNIILTPHAIGITDDMISTCWNGCVDAVLAVRDGKMPESVVTDFSL